MRALSGLPVLLGLALMGVYVWEAVIVPWGEPDQSLLYWYAFLPLTGAILVRFGMRLRGRTARRTDEEERGRP